MSQTKELIRPFLKLGQSKVEELVDWFFKVGIVIAFIKSLAVGYLIYNTSTYDKTISYFQNGVKYFTSSPAPNLPLAIISAIILFLVAVVLWKFICEFLFIVLKYFQSNTKISE